MVKTIKKNDVKFLMDFDYNNVLGRLKLVLGSEVSIFADVRVKHSDVNWYIPEGIEYIPLSETNGELAKVGRERLRVILDNLRSKIKQDALLGSHVDRILSYPSEDFVYFCQKNDEYSFVITGWGCQLEHNLSAANVSKTQEDVEDATQSSEPVLELSEETVINRKEIKPVEEVNNAIDDEPTGDNRITESVDEVKLPMTFTRAIKTCFAKYATFSGRATRSEYWYFFLFNFVINIAFTIMAFSTSRSVSDGIVVVSLIYSLFVLLPSLAVGVRRLHDSGHSAWWLLINLVFICYIGPIWYIVLMCRATESEENQYGPVPDDYYA